MSGGHIVRTGLTAAFVVVVLALLVGQAVGQPVLLGYVTSDSMEPTISEGDGFVTVPAFVTGEPEEGDVVVFDAKELHDGGLTTHRVVGETDEGYITKGDANPFRDQDADEPPVREGQIVAHALEVNGEVVTIPHLGTAVMTVHSAVTAPFETLGSEQAGTILVFAGLVLLVLAGAMSDRHQRETSRTRNREAVVSARLIVLVAVVIVVGAATLAMVMPAGVYEFQVAATDDPTDDPNVVEPGETAQIEYETQNSGILPVLVITEAVDEDVAVEPEQSVLTRGDRVESTVSVSVPDEPGVYHRHVRQSRYLVVLPPRVLAGLHAIHPIAALVAVDLVVAALVLATGRAIFGTGHLRMRTAPDHVPLAVRLRRRFRR